MACLEIKGGRVECREEVRYQDVYHKALCYCLGISDDTKRNIKRIYDFKTGCVKTECMHEGWQTSGSVKVVRMAFNLYCNGTSSVSDYDSDEEIEQVRVKAVGEERYIEPRLIESARRRAKEQEKKRKEKEAMEAAKALEEMTVKTGDETKTKEQLKRDMKSREQLPKEESSEVLAKYRISQMQILDSYSPMYEFED